MDIRAYSTKDLPYHFVLFYNIPPERRIRPGDDAVLTYCYIDREAGLTYEFICTALTYSNGNFSLHDGVKGTGIKFREGGIISDAVVYPESRFPQFIDRTECIKRIYGYNIDMIRAIERKRFSDCRHVCYPDDVLVELSGMNIKTEQIWVTDVPQYAWPDKIRDKIGTKMIHSIHAAMIEMEFAGAGRLLNEPYSREFGYHKGDIVPIYSYTDSNGKENPVVPARFLFVLG